MIYTFKHRLLANDPGFLPYEKIEAVSTLYRTGYHVDMKTTPAWYEEKRLRTGTSRSHSPTDRTGAVGRRGFGAENTIYAPTAVYFSTFSICGFQEFFVACPWILGLSSSANFINFSRFIGKFSFHSSAATLPVTKLSHQSLHRPDLIQNNLARDNLLLLVLFVVSFSISKLVIAVFLSSSFPMI